MDARARLLLGDWHPMVRDPVDLLRAAFLVGAAIELATGTYGGAIRLVLTMGLVLVPRILDLPRLFDLAFIVGMSLQAWGNVFELFEEYSWYDTLVHVVLTGLAAPTAYLALVRVDVFPDPTAGAHGRQILGIFLVTYFLGQGFDAVYEMYEYAADGVLGTNLNKGLEDTVSDMFAAGLGAAGGALLLVWWVVRGWGTMRRVPDDALEREARAS